MLLFIFIAFILFAQIVLGLVVFLKDTSAWRNRLFAMLSLALFFWAMLHFAFDAFPDYAGNIYVVRFTMFFVVLQNLLFFLFARSIAGRTGKISKRMIGYFLLTIMTMILSLTPLTFNHLEVNDQGGLYPVAQPGMLFFLLHAVISVTAGFRSLVYRFRNSKGYYREQVVYILLGSSVLWGIVPITNMFVSIAFQTTVLAAFSPLYVFVFSSLIAVAVVKYRLFDIRSVIARSFAYILALLVVVGIYILAIIGLTQIIDQGGDSSVTNPLYLGGVMVLVVTFYPLKRYFDKITDGIFFRHTYSPQKILDELGDIISNDVELSKLLIHVSRSLKESLKSSYVSIYLTQEEHKTVNPLVSRTNEKRVMPSQLVDMLLKTKKSMIVVDEVTEEFDDLIKHFHYIDAALVVKLNTSKKTLGFLVLGYKKDGGMYYVRDTNLLSVVSNELAVAIQNVLRFEEIRSFNETLQLKVDEATAALVKSNEKLKLLDEAKDDFISMASHQLRTPLTSIKGYLSMILEGDVGELTPQQAKVLKEAYASSQRMVYLIGDFLNVSRLQTGRFELEKTMVDLPQIIGTEIDQLRATAEARQIELLYDAPSNLPKIEVDENKIRQVMMNFIDNAIYYAKPGGGTVAISLVKHSKHIIFQVRDDGIGVPKKEQLQLFTKFYRASNARKARPDGTGIGLFMSKKVIVAHGGVIIFESVEGKGSTFGFRLPISSDTK